MAATESGTGVLKLGSPAIRTAHRTVTDRLRQAIVTGELPAGTRLIQADLAQSLEVSVTPVREALRDLAGEALVDFDAFRGAVVHPATVEELDEVYELRQILVPIAIRASVERISDVDIERAAQLAAAMKAEKDPAEWVHLNREFHCLLDEAAGRPKLQEILGRLADLSALYVGVAVSGQKTRRQRADRDHSAIVAAYKQRDAERVIEISMRHLEDTLGAARRQLAERT